MEKTFQAYTVEETGDGTFIGSLRTRALTDLPEGAVLVRVRYSSLNYKDALSASGNRGVTKRYPHTPGIDAAGIVEESSVDSYRKGEEVIVTGFDLGMNTPGGFGQYIRVPSEWIVKCPRELSLREAMSYGTAGFTAAMAVFELTKKIPPNRGSVLVTGASGGVGSFAVALLSELGYRVTAVSGKSEAQPYLESLGAEEVIGRNEAVADSDRPLLKGRWAGVIDSVGGTFLAAAVKSLRERGFAASCGNAASSELPLTVFPFILRGVTLQGIDSQNAPLSHRKEIWNLLAREWRIGRIEDMITEIPLDKLSHSIDLMLDGKITGRVLLNLG